MVLGVACPSVHSEVLSSLPYPCSPPTPTWSEICLEGYTPDRVELADSGVLGSSPSWLLPSSCGHSWGLHHGRQSCGLFELLCGVPGRSVVSQEVPFPEKASLARAHREGAMTVGLELLKGAPCTLGLSRACSGLALGGLRAVYSGQRAQWSSRQNGELDQSITDIAR